MFKYRTSLMWFPDQRSLQNSSMWPLHTITKYKTANHNTTWWLIQLSKFISQWPGCNGSSSDHYSMISIACNYAVHSIRSVFRVNIFMKQPGNEGNETSFLTHDKLLINCYTDLLNITFSTVFTNTQILS